MTEFLGTESWWKVNHLRHDLEEYILVPSSSLHSIILDAMDGEVIILIFTPIFPLVWMHWKLPLKINLSFMMCCQAFCPSESKVIKNLS